MVNAAGLVSGGIITVLGEVCWETHTKGQADEVNKTELK